MFLGTLMTSWETFLSYEDPEQDILIGLLRLRKLRYGLLLPPMV